MEGSVGQMLRIPRKYQPLSVFSCSLGQKKIILKRRRLMMMMIMIMVVIMMVMVMIMMMMT